MPETVLDACPVLRERYQSRLAETADGRTVRIRSTIGPHAAEILYRQVRAYRPTTVVEVGFAFGSSTLAMLSALRDNRHGHLWSIDPKQDSVWNGAGRVAVERAGLADRHTHVAEPSALALPTLFRGGTRIDFGYIDGWHTFDAAFLDWWYIDRMLPPGGVVAFNDVHMPAIRKVLRFVRTHRDYRVLRTEVRWRRWARLADRYLEKRMDCEPAWNFYAPF